MREERASAGMVVVFWKSNKHHTERTEYPFFIYCILCLKDGLNSSLQPPQTHALFSFSDSYGCTAKGTPYFGPWHLNPHHCPHFPIRAPPGSELLLLQAWPRAWSHFVPAFPLSQQPQIEKMASNNFTKLWPPDFPSQVPHQNLTFPKPQRGLKSSDTF